MKKSNYIFIFLISILSIQTVFGSSYQKEKINIERIDSTETSLFNKILEFEVSIKNEPENTIDLLNNILPITIKQNSYRETGLCYMLLGRCYKILQQPSISLQYMKLAKSQFDIKKIEVFLTLEEFQEKNTYPNKKFRNREIYTSIELEQNILPLIYYRDLAEIHRQLGDHNKSIETYRILKERNNNITSQDEIEYIIAQNQFESRDYKASIATYKKLLIREKHNNHNLNITNCCRRLAACYYELGDTEKVQTYLKLAKVGIDQTVNDSIFTIIQEDEISNNTKIKTSLFSQQQLKQRHKILNQKNLNSLDYLDLAKKYYRKGEYQKAERAIDKYFANICYALFEEIEIKIIRDVAHQLNNSNRPKKALEYLMHYEALRDTIKNHQIAASNKSLQTGAKGLQNILFTEKLQRDKELKNKEFSFLQKEKKFAENIILILLIGIILVTVGIIYLRKISKQRKVANQQLALRSLRSQMNPHFIFNALNSVNSFISSNNEREANKFLSEFSSLMRTVMENSEYDFIPLTKELEIINIYLQLEHHRFKDKFQFQLNVDENIDEDQIQLPPMLIQPYIENAIWHGLRYKKDKGFLSIHITHENDALIVQIADDGIGRTKSKTLKTKNQKKNKSIALKNIGQRIDILGKLHHIKIEVKISDLNPEEEDTGTKIVLRIPQKK